MGNTALLQARANALDIDVKLTSYTSTDTAKPHRTGYLPVIDLPLSNDCQPGEPDPLNASYVLAQLELAASLCQAGEFQGMVTAPVHKAVINDAGTPFSGHTEFLTDTTGAQHVVMLLATDALRVALATTHLPLRHVSDALSSDVIERALRTFIPTSFIVLESVNRGSVCSVSTRMREKADIWARKTSGDRARV